MIGQRYGFVRYREISGNYGRGTCISPSSLLVGYRGQCVEKGNGRFFFPLFYKESGGGCVGEDPSFLRGRMRDKARKSV